MIRQFFQNLAIGRMRQQLNQFTQWVNQRGWSPAADYWAKVCWLALAYCVAGRIGLELAMVGSLVTLVWMPTGIAVAALFRWGWRFWPGVWLGALAVNLIVGANFGVSLGVSLGNTLAPVVAALALKRWRFNPDIGSARDVLIFVGVAALLSMTVSASGGALSLLAGRNISTDQAGYAWFTWWLGDAVGVILAGMALVTYRSAEYRRLLSGELRGALVVSVIWVLLVGFAWMTVPANPVGQILSLTFPVGVLVWIAFRLGPSPAAFAVMGLAILGSWALVHGSGPFADDQLYLAITKFWAYMNTVAIVVLLVSALNGERTKAHHNLARSEARFRSLTKLSSDWYWEQDADFRFVRVEGEGETESANPMAIAEQIGQTRWELPALNLSESDWEVHKATLAAHLPFYDFEIARKDRAGVTRWSSVSGVPSRGPGGTFTGYHGVGKDITERKRAQDAVTQLAHYDRLTGLPNRTLFMDRLTTEIQRVKRSGQQVGVMLLDLDDFKAVNDTLGHDQGDLLLMQAAQRIRSCLRETDVVGRLGGDEFTVIVGGVEDIRAIEVIAEKVLAVLVQPFQLAAGKGFVSASIGIAMYPSDEMQIDDLLKAADQAMYAAKAAGRNRFNFFTRELQNLAQHRQWLTRELHEALRLQQFSVVYQPIINLETGRCSKAEALVRWQHPDQGAISPAQFIGVAESSGLIVPLGEWVFQQAAQQVRRLRSILDVNFQISVNKSPVQFNDADKVRIPWRQQLEALGLPGDSIVAEITEGLLLDDKPTVAQRLREFQEAGIQVALDDFGTGFSSLAYLQKHDIDYLKIDQVFVRNLACSAKDLAVCEAIVVMAHKLGLKVIAEGVETTEQRDLLRAAGCDYAQGYLFAKPLSAQALEAFLSGQ
jgi:diguanylate cyclase (GGDEF)-like protein/PAS domain S-box-containing protein